MSDNSCVEILEPALPLLKVDQHHYPFVIIFDIAEEKTTSNVESLDFDFSRCDFESLNTCFANVDWEEILVGCSLDEAVQHLNEQLLTILRDVVPLRRASGLRAKRQPWWNNELQRLRNRLRKVRKRFSG